MRSLIYLKELSAGAEVMTFGGVVQHPLDGLDLDLGILRKGRVNKCFLLRPPGPHFSVFYLQQLHQLLLLPRLSQLVSSVGHLVLKSPPAAADLSELPADALAAEVLFGQHLLPQLEENMREHLKCAMRDTGVCWDSGNPFT